MELKLHVIDEAPDGRVPVKHNARCTVTSEIPVYSRLVKRRCTDSSWFMSVTATGLQYSTIGQTYVEKALHKILAS